MTRTTKAKLATAARKAARAAVKMHKLVQQVEDGMAKAGTEFVKNGIDYMVDKQGRPVRQPRRDNQVKTEEVRHVLLNTRVVEIEDVLFACGKWITDYLIQNDYLRRDAKCPTMLWVTKEAAFKYQLPRPVVGGVACNFV